MSRILYLGTDPSRFARDVVHYPIIESKPLPLPHSVVRDFEAFTHIILTSPSAARILVPQMPLQDKQILAIGTGTAAVLAQLGLKCSAVAFPETQEGLIALLKKMPLEKSYLFYPRSSRARPLLASYLKQAALHHLICDLYETVFLRPDPLLPLEDFDEIIFTSPSTIRAFLALYGSLPKNKKFTCIGPITERAFLELWVWLRGDLLYRTSVARGEAMDKYIAEGILKTIAKVHNLEYQDLKEKLNLLGH